MGGRRAAGPRGDRLIVAPGPEIGAAPPVPPLLPGEPPLAILVDYDGTVALTDVSDTVMAEHVPGIWEAEAAAYDAGRMGSRRLMEIEIGLIDAPAADLLATAAAQPHDPVVRSVRPACAGGRSPRRDRVATASASSSGRPSRRSGWGTCRSSRHARRSGAGAPRSRSRTATRPASCAGRASATACSPIRPQAAPSCSSATASRTATPQATATSSGPSARSSGSPSRPAGSSTAGRSSARSTRGWRTCSRRGERIRRASPARAPGPISAAPRSGATGSSIRRLTPGRLAPVRPTSPSAPSARTPRTAPSRA